ncbi:TonB-dependent receptor [Hymenobacter segetis]|uniref:TonB-dependent receptor n=1 Tax=Hymenobacter segetis TaxID=2025509 RepID=A0ABU9LX51_9BACT
MKKHLLLLWLLLLGSIGLAAAQSRQVQGVVKAADGETLPGVTVLVEGTTNGASTGANGDFSITLPANSANATLRFSYVGYVSQAVKVGSQSTINVTLASDSKQLDDVVVIGYQEVQRRDVTGSVSSVSAQQIKDVPVNSAAEALTGRLAGVQLTTSEGTPGAAVTVRVRGGGSITQDNSPLYVVDGVQVENALSTIAPQDIQSVDVLKDASATAIYGARGANGVVIITTKIGKEGRTTVSYTGFAGVRQISKKLDILGPGDFVRYQYERAQLAGTTAQADFKKTYGTLRYDSLSSFNNLPNIDWQERVFGRDAFQQTHNVSIAGGAKGTNYSLSLTRNTEDGIQLNSGFDRYLVNFRLDSKVSEKFRAGFNARYNVTNTQGSGTSSTGTSTTSRLRNVIEYRPFDFVGGAVQDQDAFDESQATSGARLGNAVTLINQEYRRNTQKVLNVNGSASYSFRKNLTFRSTVGVETTNQVQNAFNGPVTPVARQNGNMPTASINTAETVTVNNNNVLTYNFNKGKHSFDALVGQETYQINTTGLNVGVLYLPSTITAERALAGINQSAPPAGVQPTLSSSNVTSRLLSGFSRLSYNYDDKYLLTATFRADGSSKFAPGRRVGYFPAASVAWRLSKEGFMQPYTNTISDLKLRLSYGLSGNNRIGDALYLSQFGVLVPPINPASGPATSQYGFGETLVPGLASTALANQFLKWETTASRNVGLDLALFNNRVQFTVDAYYNNTYDLLLSKAVPSTSGYSLQQQNVGKTSNKGVEFQLSGTVFQTPDFTWTANTNLSINRNQVESLGDGADFFLFNSNWAGSDGPSSDYLIQVGKPLGQVYGYVADGFYKASDFEGYTAGVARTWKPKTGVAVNPNAFAPEGPGDIRFKDLNGDGLITELDRTVIGNTNPKFTGGLNNQFAYKGFDASIFVNWVVGNDIYNANKVEFSSALYANTNLLSSAYNSGTYRTNDPVTGQLVTDIGRLEQINQNATSPTPSRGRYITSSANIENGSFLRLNNLTLGYTLPKALTQRAKITTVRFYVTASNLYTFTKYSGYDPEVSARPRSPLSPGLDYAAYPRSRAMLAGLNLTF